MITGMGEIIRGEALTAYHAHRSVWNHSKVREFTERGPLRAIKVMRGEIVPEQTAAMAQGSLLDDLLTGGDTAKYVTRPDGLSFATKAGKEWRDEQQAAGRVIVGADEWAWAKDAREAILAIPEARDVLEEAEAQVTFRCTLAGELDGLAIQSRPDWYQAVGPARYDYGATFPDLKTTADLGAFFDRRGYAVSKYGYHTQAAMVRLCARLAGVEGETHHQLIVCDKQDPVRAAVVRIDAWIETATFQVLDALRRIHRCQVTGTWPRSEVTYAESQPPPWLVEMVGMAALDASPEPAWISGEAA